MRRSPDIAYFEVLEFCESHLTTLHQENNFDTLQLNFLDQTNDFLAIHKALYQVEMQQLAIVPFNMI